MSPHPLEEILRPKSIAVAGASAKSFRDDLFKPLLHYGFRGNIYPVNPKYTELLGVKVYPSVRDIPGPVDYVISAIPSTQVLGLLDDCIHKGVKAIHLFTGRFSETGRQDAAELEQEILRRARNAGIRLIGPNCMGVYHPAAGISFKDGLPKEPGRIGLASQSGGVAADIVDTAAVRGLRFSKAISYGNALDFNECDYLEYFAQDPETDIILMYIEGTHDGRKFFDILQRTTPDKPVIIVKGGRGQSGAWGIASHTGSLAGSMQVWEAMVKQAGAVAASNLEELVDLGVAFHFLPPITGYNVGIAGGGGGTSVLAADECEAAGLNVIPLPEEMRQELKDTGNRIWDWINNPWDMSIREGRNWSVGEVLKLMASNKEFDLLVTFLRDNYHNEQDNVSVEAYVEEYHLDKLDGKPLLAVVEERFRGPADNRDRAWMLELVGKARARFTAAGIPIYASTRRAARTAVKLIDYYRYRGQ
jgi:acetyltransferase